MPPRTASTRSPLRTRNTRPAWPLATLRSCRSSSTAPWARSFPLLPRSTASRPPSSRSTSPSSQSSRTRRPRTSSPPSCASLTKPRSSSTRRSSPPWNAARKSTRSSKSPTSSPARQKCSTRRRENKTGAASLCDRLWGCMRGALPVRAECDAEVRGLAAQAEGGAALRATRCGLRPGAQPSTSATGRRRSRKAGRPHLIDNI
mmetsp:Transcript_24739/g.72735  ORF Transcript_24739/g.72735 Transcript_24739/m.72735 type:complete len:203 (-) Transcript_24739:5-613(-)